jgi:GNAT superfamily N-acetyltransferase
VRWHHAEWSGLFPGWTEADALAELAASADADGPVPMTLVALRHQDGTAPAGAAPGGEAVLLGSVSLLAEDSPELRAFEGPWLASLYVAPAARGQGVGEALVHALVEAARQSGLRRLRLFTPHHRAFYERLGWRFEARARSGGEAVDVLARALPGPGG